MAREYVKAYHDWLKQMSALSDSEVGRLFRAILNYSATGSTENLRGREGALLPVYQSQIDRDEKQYNADCENGRLGGRPSGKTNKTQNNGQKPNETQNNQEEEIRKKNKEKEVRIKMQDNTSAAASKHKYGKYNNVLLEDSQYQKLKEDYPLRYEQMIDKLSEGLEIKNYKYKNHYLVILKWDKNDNIEQEKEGKVKYL